MNRIFAGVKILRPLNMTLSMLAVLIAAFLIDGLTSPLLPYALLVVLSFAGASNILNDVLDIHIDEVNRPERVLPSGRLRIRDAVILMSILFALGILCTFYLHPLGRNLALIIVLPMLVLYTPLFKGIPFIGNLVVGSILGLVFLFTEAGLLGSTNLMRVPFFLATGLSTIRELVKDGADLDGDGQGSLKTFPHKFGIPATVWLLRILTLGLCFGALIPVWEGWYGTQYGILLVTLVELPLLWAVFFKLTPISGINDFIYSAKVLKGITIAGLVVILSTSF